MHPSHHHHCHNYYHQHHQSYYYIIYSYIISKLYWSPIWLYVGCPAIASNIPTHHLQHLCLCLALRSLYCARTLMGALLSLLSCFDLQWPLLSAFHGDLLVPFAHTSTMHFHWAFSVVGPTIRNSIPLELRLHPRTNYSAIYSSLKTMLSAAARPGVPLSEYLEGALYPVYIDWIDISIS